MLAAKKNQQLVKRLKGLATSLEGDLTETLMLAAQTIEDLGEQVARLRFLMSRPYRPRTEKVNPDQLTLSLLQGLMGECEMATPQTNEQANSQGEKEQEDPPKRPKRNKRKSNIEGLPVQVQVRDLCKEECVCQRCGAQKKQVGQTRMKQIIFEPAKLYVLEEICNVYQCGPCDLDRDERSIAPSKAKPFEKSLASSSLLAALVVKKLVDGTPIERIAKEFLRHGASFATSTHYEWFNRAGNDVASVVRFLKKEILKAALVSFDDTPFPAKNKDHPRGIQKGRLWAYIGDIDQRVYCEFTEDWKGKHPIALLEGFNGTLQYDGYGGADKLFRTTPSPNRKRAGCNDHARRKFFEAWKQGDARAGPFLEYYGQLYAVERKATFDKVCPQQRLALRKERSLTIWNALTKSADTHKEMERKSTFGKAIGYFLNQSEYLKAFLDDGTLPISNAHVERLLRTVALVRKNVLFVGSLSAGERFANLVTLAANCMMCGANPYDYFVKLFDAIGQDWPVARVGELIPQRLMNAEVSIVV